MDLSSTPLLRTLAYDERPETTWAEEMPAPRPTVFMASLTVLIASCGLIGNGVVFWLLGFQIKRGPVAVYIFNLTIADFFFLLCHTIHHLGTLFFSRYLDTGLFAEFFESMSENFLMAMSIEHCVSVLCPVWYRSHCPRHTSATICVLLWILVALLSVSGHFICEHLPNSNECEGFALTGDVWVLLISLLFVASLTLMLCIQCYRCQCPKASSFLVFLIAIIFQLLLYNLPFVIYLFSNESNILLSGNGKDLDVLLSCLENSILPFTYFFVGCCKQRRDGEPLRVLLQRVLMDEEELEDGTEIVYDSRGEVTLTQRTQGSSEEPRRGDASFPHLHPELSPSLACPKETGFPSYQIPTSL